MGVPGVPGNTVHICGMGLKGMTLALSKLSMFCAYEYSAYHTLSYAFLAHALIFPQNRWVPSSKMCLRWILYVLYLEYCMLNSDYVLISGMHLTMCNYSSKIVGKITPYLCLFPYKSKIGLVRVYRGSLNRRERSNLEADTHKTPNHVVWVHIKYTTFATVYPKCTCLCSLMPRPHPAHVRPGFGHETNVSASQNTCAVIC